MKRLAAILVLAGPFLPALAADAMPGPSARDLWEYITTVDSYKQWPPFPGIDDPFIQVGEKPHGDWVAVHVNQIANDSMSHPLEPFTMRYGSIIVKENYPASKEKPSASELLSVTVMYKINGYHSLPQEEEWFWVMYTPQGEVAVVDKQPWAASKDFAPFRGEVQTGKPWFCLSCHQSAKESSKKAVGDYLWKLKPFETAKD